MSQDSARKPQRLRIVLFLILAVALAALVIDRRARGPKTQTIV
jgi:hypothetical protein